jgi:hypothetical protein
MDFVSGMISKWLLLYYLIWVVLKRRTSDKFPPVNRFGSFTQLATYAESGCFEIYRNLTFIQCNFIDALTNQGPP